MARPIKQGLDYFPMDVDIDQDDKIVLVEAEFGNLGFAVVIKLLNKIYKEGYFYEWSAREQKLFSKRIDVSINDLTNIVDVCINESIFNKALFEKYGILTSRGIQKRYLEAAKRRKQVIFYKEYFLIEDVGSIIGNLKNPVILVNVDTIDGQVVVNVNNNPSVCEVNVDISTQRKGKERKAEERKAEEIHAGDSEALKEEPKEPAAKNPIRFIEEQVNIRLTPLDMQSILKYEDEFNGNSEIINHAATISSDRNKKSFGFIKALLNEWLNNNCQTLEGVLLYEKNKYAGNRPSGTKKTGTIDYSSLIEEEAL